MALVKYNNNSISAITSTAGMPAGAMTLIKEQTASSSSTISFVHGTSDVVLDSTYPIYLFKFINIHPATDSAKFMVNFRDGGSSYDATKTTTAFFAQHSEDGGTSGLTYSTGDDVAQSTGNAPLSLGVGNGNDESYNGEMFLYSPSSTTFVKHFISTTNIYYSADRNIETFVSGYANVTAAIDGVQFVMESGNIDSGTIKLYGIKDS